MGAGPAGPGRKARRSCAAAYNALMPTATVPGAAAPWPPAAPAAPLAVLVSGGLDSAILLAEAARAYPAVFPLYVRARLFLGTVEQGHLGRVPAAVPSPALRRPPPRRPPAARPRTAGRRRVRRALEPHRPRGARGGHPGRRRLPPRPQRPAAVQGPDLVPLERGARAGPRPARVEPVPGRDPGVLRRIRRARW